MTDVSTAFLQEINSDDAFRSVVVSGDPFQIYDAMAAKPSIWNNLPDEAAKRLLAVEVYKTDWSSLESVWLALLNEDQPSGGPIFC